MNHDLINATDLSQWAVRREAESLLPELVRRLVSVSVSPSDLDDNVFASREGVNSGGWDGVTIAKSNHTHVPKGSSGWEMGKTKDGIKAKADDDYEKRTTAIAKKERDKTTFIFVTPHRWASKSKWASGRKEEKKWKDVKVFDADDLLTWLEQHSAVHHWITGIIKGYPIPGLTPGETFWKNWSNATKPPVSPDFLLAGREAQAKELVLGFSKGAFTLVVNSPSSEEALAFVVAAMKSLPTKLSEELLNRTLVIDNEHKFSQMVESEQPLILIPTFRNPNSSYAKEKGHTVILPSTAKQPTSTNSLVLPDLSVDQATEVLNKEGVDHSKAYELSKLARRSLVAFRRESAIHPESLSPEWMSSDDGTDLVPALLAGSWQETNEQDKKIVEEITGIDYGEYEKLLIRWKSKEDPPLIKRSSTWRIVSDKDAINTVVQYMTSEQLSKFQQAALKVLGTEDPAYDLPVDERWMANVRGYKHPYSKNIRKGIAQSLTALASLHPEAIPAGGTVTYSQITDHIAGQLLEDANKDTSGKKWFSLMEISTLLAEASPEKFLEAVENDLSSQDPILKKMFIEDNNFFVSSPHTSLLFALELLSWNKDYVAQASLCLAKLAEIDPGSNSSNRPLNSLVDILSVVRPQTSINGEDRLKIIDLISARHPEVGADLLISLVPGNHVIHFGNAEPKYRDWKPEKLPSITYAEMYKMIGEIVTRLIRIAGANKNRWKSILEKLTDLPTQDFDAVVQTLTELPKDKLDEETRLNIWNELRSIISRHREFPDADWSYPKEQIDKLGMIYKSLEPTTSSTRHSWLFNHRVNLLDPSGNGWQENGEIASKLRVEAVAEVYKQEALDGVNALAQKAEVPFYVGSSLSTISKKDATTLLNQIEFDDSRAEVARGYATKQANSQGLQWVSNILEQHSNWDTQHKAKFLLGIPASKELWELVEGQGVEVEKEYWQGATPYGLGADFSHYGYAAEKLIIAEKPYEAIAALNYVEKGKETIPNPKTVISALELALEANPKDSSVDLQMLGYYVAELMKSLPLDQVDRDKIIQLEMSWYPLLKDDRKSEFELYKKIAEDPKFFVELISILYKAKSAPKKEPTKVERQRAELVDDILRRWHTPPGVLGDNSINYTKMRNWVTRAIRQLGEIDRSSPGEYHIGQILFDAPPASDGKWPQEEVCKLLEEVKSERLEQGFISEAFGSRDVVMVSREEDRSISSAEEIEKRASEISFTYPHAAKVLRQTAQTLRSRSKFLFRDED